MNKWYLALGGLAIGVLNGLFGSGGGMAAVPLLTLLGLPQQKSHATSIAVILPLTALSALLYLQGGMMQVSESLPYLAGGAAGAIAGAFLLGRLSPALLKKLFGVLILFAAVRMWLR